MILSNEVEQISDEVDLKELMKYNKKKGKGLVGTKRTSELMSPVKQECEENIATPTKSKKKVEKSSALIEKKNTSEDQRPQRNLAKTKTSKICAPNSES